jgi:tRNA(Met) C34 N-acetyltransferase TmcA
MAKKTRTIRARAPEHSDENPRERFLRIGQPRVRNALHAIRLVGNLSAPHYEVHPDDVAIMHQAVLNAVEQAFGRFERSTMTKLEDTFSLVPEKTN